MIVVIKVDVLRHVVLFNKVVVVIQTYSIFCLFYFIGGVVFIGGIVFIGAVIFIVIRRVLFFIIRSVAIAVAVSGPLYLLFHLFHFPDGFFAFKYCLLRSMDLHACILVSVDAAVPTKVRGGALLVNTASGVVILVLHVECVRIIRIEVYVVIIS
ncbi:hypothetical protein SNOG_20128 [Parastagonospora nodorum SN15]|uniref:Uncharacterized protein n=1 Tax=Phaeosphaeria nodorum (strain SN15 / ATCC MYA-4574 / FGSC 10173) TaxID=321614 RepID=A9JXC4_PHANO|nr:hypothetical protein SNOG_20128 [Parastagonospora nodorum SN15]EDP89814.1 hypothetical protein SNOG_20128 [Parastagonospora nodorum SN15]